MRMKDLVGKTFGRLFVEEMVREGRHSKFRCTCICGKTSYPFASAVQVGRTQSCGCLNRELAIARAKFPVEETITRRLYQDYQNGAKDRKLTFGLTFSEFCEFLHESCHYCKRKNCSSRKVNRIGKNVPLRYNGIDRKNSDLGYSIENCVTYCWVCNRAKMDMTYNEFIDYINHIRNLGPVK